LKLFGILANIGLCEVPLIPASAGVARLKVSGVGPGEALAMRLQLPIMGG
jgi:hypothetical protein